jgi:carboxyl-terminal processing protease
MTVWREAGAMDGGGWRAAPRPRAVADAGLRALVTLGLALVAASCDTSALRSGPFGFGHATFEETVEEYPQLAAVSTAFDRNVRPEPSPGERLRQLDLFAEVFDITYNDYVEPVGVDQMVQLTVEGLDQTASEVGRLELEGEGDEERSAVAEDALSAPKLMASGLVLMLSHLDPHSAYLPPDVYREMKVRTRGEFGGIGIEVTMEDGLVKVVAPIDDTPGSRAGMRTGDLITHVDGKPIQGLTLAEAVRMIRGPVGSRVVLSVRRQPASDSFDVAIVRALIRIRAVRARVEGNVAYIRITTFNEQADKSLRRAMDELEDELGERMIGVVLDLRNNPGGLLDQALAVSDAFLSGGEIVSTRNRNAGTVRRFSADRGDIADGLPVVVLINGGSASASEIVSGALQDNGRAMVMGSRSFGKGSVQTIIPVSGGGAVRLTTARYYTPSGRSIQLTGISPDIVAELSDSGQRREADFDNPLPGEAITTAPDVRLLKDVCPDKLEEEDPTLACALDILEAHRTFASGPAE